MPFLLIGVLSLVFSPAGRTIIFWGTLLLIGKWVL